ncbi:MAG: hydantoinase B/oxoprolinase family protein [Alphaproteobacteria bacterium]|jgi:N-methylhydantoinase B|nr:hydantoinase B/oxoprolinase family protein [Alphaproteobacteria bacterium]MDP6566783.1 hydantoinase B/oxoprolinase family protein [Alphaproteobacteria bacterium]MDP6812283.1 hydantoinase B/oxoprolinase family protein [Alphaproteobacteria bacterium]
MTDPVGTPDRYDAVEMGVFSNRLLSITDEMGMTLVRSSFSTNIKERKDCSVGLFDHRGRLLAQAMHIPLHLGSLQGGVEAVLAAFEPDEIEPGDAFVCNDPYLAGGTHLPDISVVTPVFWQGELAYFTANIGHHTDVGGSVPGSSSHLARSIYEEGIRIPIVKICRRGQPDRHLIELIALASRDPEERRLDLGVQIATNERGGRLLSRLLEKQGVGKLRQAADDLLAYTRARMANRIAELANGDYTGEAWLDNDGSGDVRLPIRVTARIRGSELTLDFGGSGAQARGNLNVPDSALKATCFYAVKSLLDPELPPNGGLFEAIGLHAPQGSIVNPASPAPVAGRASTCQRIARAIFQAFAQVLPADRVIAPATDMNAAMALAGPRRRGERNFVYLETIGGGGGATRESDGMHAVQVHITNTTNLPAEALEIEYPLRVVEYALVEGSGGPGRRRGGAGIAREVAATADGITVSVRMDGEFTPAPGLFGGGAGGCGRVSIRGGADGPEAVGAKLATRALPKGRSLRLETPGGGGFGPPDERAAADLAADLRDGLIDVAGAAGSYGADLLERAAALGDDD